MKICNYRHQLLEYVAIMGTKGYFYAQVHKIKEGRALKRVDYKLSELYRTEITYAERRRLKSKNKARHLYVRHQNTFVLLSTSGTGRIWREQHLQDMRFVKLNIFSHTISILIREGGKFQGLIEYEREAWDALESKLVLLSLIPEPRELSKNIGIMLRKAGVMPFRGSLIQQNRMLREINQRRKAKRLLPIPKGVLIQKR